MGPAFRFFWWLRLLIGIGAVVAWVFTVLDSADHPSGYPRLSTFSHPNPASKMFETWMACMLVGGIGLIVISIYGRKK